MMMKMTAELRDIYEEFAGLLSSTLDEMPVDGDAYEKILGIFEQFYHKIVWKVVRFMKLTLLPHNASEKKEGAAAPEDLIREYREYVKSRLSNDLKYKILAILESSKTLTFRKLTSILNLSESSLRRYVRELEELKYVKVDRSTKPFRIIFLSAPWDFSPR